MKWKPKQTQLQKSQISTHETVTLLSKSNLTATSQPQNPREPVPQHASQSQGEDTDNKFRGVSRNGHFGWQIMCTIGRRQQFVATVDHREFAALIHDIIQIQNNGITVKANFDFTVVEILALVTAQSMTDVRKVATPNPVQSTQKIKEELQIDQ